MTKEGARRLILQEVKNKHSWSTWYVKKLLIKINYNQKEIDVERLKDISCKLHGITRNQLESNARLAPIISARAQCYLHLFENGYKYVDIGSIFNKNHATIIHSVNNLSGYLEYDAQIKSKYEKLNKIMEEQS